MLNFAIQYHLVHILNHAKHYDADTLFNLQIQTDRLEHKVKPRSEGAVRSGFTLLAITTLHTHWHV